jgi:hypothetical protein
MDGRNYEASARRVRRRATRIPRQGFRWPQIRARIRNMPTMSQLLILKKLHLIKIK